MSTLTLLTATLALLAPFGAAQVSVPGGSSPSAGAVLLPDASNPVTAGSPYTITWVPKTDNCGDKLDIVLLKGPSAALMAAQSYITRGVDTTAGKYIWAVPTTLVPSASDYGIEVICQQTQAYQYSTRFGLVNAAFSGESTSSSPPTSSAGSTSASSSTSTSISTPGNSTTTSPTNPTTRTSETPKYPMVGNTTVAPATGALAAAGTGGNAAVTPTVTRTSTETGAQATRATATTAATQSSAAASPAQIRAGLSALAAFVAVAFATL